MINLNIALVVMKGKDTNSLKEMIYSNFKLL